MNSLERTTTETVHATQVVPSIAGRDRRDRSTLRWAASGRHDTSGVGRGGTRTPDPLLVRQVLLPAELHARNTGEASPPAGPRPFGGVRLRFGVRTRVLGVVDVLSDGCKARTQQLIEAGLHSEHALTSRPRPSPSPVGPQRSAGEALRAGDYRRAAAWCTRGRDAARSRGTQADASQCPNCNGPPGSTWSTSSATRRTTRARPAARCGRSATRTLDSRHADAHLDVVLRHARPRRRPHRRRGHAFALRRACAVNVPS